MTPMDSSLTRRPLPCRLSEHRRRSLARGRAFAWFVHWPRCEGPGTIGQRQFAFLILEAHTPLGGGRPGGHAGAVLMAL